MQANLQSRLEAFSIEELRVLARLYGLRNYSYKELLTDLLIITADNNSLEEDVYDIESRKSAMRDFLRSRNTTGLRDMAAERGIPGYQLMNKPELIDSLIFMSFSGVPFYNKPSPPKTRKTPKPRKSRKPRKKSKNQLEDYTVKELKEEAKNRGLTGYSRMRKAELILFLS